MSNNNINRLFDAFTPNAAQKERIHEKIFSVSHNGVATAPRRRTERFRLAFRKPLVASITVIFCLMLSFPALAFAANIPATYDLLYSIAPSVAQFFKPVQKSNENNGIKMEVIEANINGDKAEIYVSLQDLTGNRIDETTDLFDSYSINCPFDSSANCRLVDYDESTKTAQFLISISTLKGEIIAGNKVIFTVREFLSGKNVYDGILFTIDMAEPSNNPSTMPFPTEYGGGYGGDSNVIGENPIVLTHSSPIDFGVDGIGITGIGYVNGMLHIQTFPGNISEHNNHGYIYFKDKDGNDIYCLYNLAFNEPQNGEMVRYEEFVFDIPQSQLNEYEAYGYFVSGAVLTKGHWQVTFPLE